MSRDKQIEEMAKVISKKQQGGWRFVIDDYTTDVGNEELAEYLYNAGYRKASEVAREIFEQIDDTMELICAMTGVDVVLFGRYAELKKMFMEGEG